MFTIVDKDIFESTEDYLCHQTNCLSRGEAAGLARLIFSKYPEVDIYASREKDDVPGTVRIKPINHSTSKVVNLMGQVFPGSARNKKIQDKRLVYFRKALWELCQVGKYSSYAFPWGIGCGLAGGDWGVYIGILKSFEKYINEQYGSGDVVIYRLP